MKKILVYGDANLDIFISGKREIPAAGTEEYVSDMPYAVGGGAALVVMGLGKLECNAAYCGTLSGDMMGKMIASSMEELGIDLSKATVDNTVRSGISLSFTDERDRSFISYAGSIAKNDVDMLKTIDYSDVGHVHITGYNAGKRDKYLNILKFIKEKGNITTSYDVAFDETGLWDPKLTELMPFVDVFFMNEVEAAGYSGGKGPEEAADYFADFGHTIVIKAGKKGSFLKKKGEELLCEKTVPVKAVDTTGAGDSFNAGFLWAFTNGLDSRTALRCGNFCGGRCVTAKGGNTAFPRLEELKKGILL
ncbi:MAG: carbohydrate kinase family protein [Lachnospiraceae bacterium]|nr:carbohydrate kinase family protein [Lachnospiraceae bacterium]